MPRNSSLPVVLPILDDTNRSNGGSFWSRNDGYREKSSERTLSNRARAPFELHKNNRKEPLKEVFFSFELKLNFLFSF